METRNENLVVAAEAVANNASAANEIVAPSQSVEPAAAVVVDDAPASDAAPVAGQPYRETLTVCNVDIHPSEEEGVGATIALTFKEEIDGYRVPRETHIKEFTKVHRVSFFVSEVIRVMAQNFIVGSWLKSKKKDEVNELLPVVLMGSKLVVESLNVVDEQKMMRDIISIKIEDMFLDTMKSSVLARI